MQGAVGLVRRTVGVPSAVELDRGGPEYSWVRAVTIELEFVHGTTYDLGVDVLLWVAALLDI
jgi:hypothetical protein